MTERVFERSEGQQSPLLRRERLFHLLEKEGLTEEMMQRAIDVPEIREKLIKSWKLFEGAHATEKWWKEQQMKGGKKYEYL